MWLIFKNLKNNQKIKWEYELFYSLFDYDYKMAPPSIIVIACLLCVSRQLNDNLFCILYSCLLLSLSLFLFYFLTLSLSLCFYTILPPFQRKRSNTYTGKKKEREEISTTTSQQNTSFSFYLSHFFCAKLIKSEERKYIRCLR